MFAFSKKQNILLKYVTFNQFNLNVVYKRECTSLTLFFHYYGWNYFDFVFIISLVVHAPDNLVKVQFHNDGLQVGNLKISLIWRLSGQQLVNLCSAVKFHEMFLVELII